MTKGRLEAQSDPYWIWGKDATRPRLLHTMIRVRNVEASLRFYQRGLGMKLQDRYDFEAKRFTIFFLSFTDYQDGPSLELTHNWDQTEDYSHGTGYGHIAIGVPDVACVYERLAQYEGVPISAPKALAPGAPEIAFVQDPDGYMIELIQTKQKPRE